MSNSPFNSTPALLREMAAMPISDLAAEVLPHVPAMTAAMVEYKLLGLAAPQVGIDAAFFLVAEDGKIRVVINPTFDSPSYTKSKRRECGLDPANGAEVARPLFIWCRYTDEEGHAHGMQLIRGRARIWLHLSEYLTGQSAFAGDVAPAQPQKAETA